MIAPLLILARVLTLELPHCLEFNLHPWHPCIEIITTKTTIPTQITITFIIMLTDALCVLPGLIKRHDCISAC